MDRLLSLDVDTFMAEGKEANDAIESYSVSLQDMLDKHHIHEFLEQESGDRLSLSAMMHGRASSSHSSDHRLTVTAPMELDKAPLYGYKRILFALLFCVVLSVVAAAVH
jgi:hypothetical protein